MEKIIESIDIDDWEIETDSGFENISSIHKTIQFDIWKIELENNLFLECADEHIVFDKFMNEIYVKDLSIGNFIRTKFGLSKVLNITQTNEKDHMYDVTVDSNNHRFYSNDILSHNTTTSAAVILWHVLFIRNYEVAILANKLATAREILARVQRAFENLPPWLQQGVKNWNKTNVELENGSKIMASSTGSSAIRGFSINFLYLDEFAFIPRNMQTDFFTSVYPTIISGTNTKVVISSTPNGFNLFYKMWKDSIEGRNEYANIAVHWSDIPGRDEEWREKTIANTSETQFRQEFEAEFIGSSNTLISPEVLRRLSYAEPIRTLFNDALRIYKEPVLGNTYFGTVDTARGVGIDASAFVIFDLTTYPFEIVAVYSSNTIDPLILPEHIHQTFQHYNTAPALIEINDNGQQVADILYHELQYEEVIFTSTKGKHGQQLAGDFGTNLTRGVRTTKSVKRIGCANVRTLIENDQLILNDFHLLREFTTFIVQGVSYGAEGGSHDDMVMCVVLLAWATEQEFFKNITNTNFRKKLLEQNEKMVYDDTLPFGFIITGEEDIEEFLDSDDSYVL